jgi:hypothetical protein
LKLATLLLYSWSIFQSQAQISIQILDSSSQRPIVGASIGIASINTILNSDLEGNVILPESLRSADLIQISNLGYERQSYPYSSIPHIIYLNPKTYQLKETVIQPILPRRYIEMAFDSFLVNHVPFPFKQKVFFREEFIVNNSYLRFQELEMNIYQFPKKHDHRKYYISGSYPEVLKMYRIDDYRQMNQVKYAVGKLLSKHVYFNQISLYSNAKGTNILNLIFTELLQDNNAKYRFMANENIKGYQTIHIQGEHFDNNTLLYTTHIYIEPISMAVLHFSLLASDENMVNHWIDFKTKILMWIMGIKINVSKFYFKVQFEKNKENFWSVSDVTAMCPIEFSKKAKLNCTVIMNYRMNNLIERADVPSAKLYGQNQILFNQYKSSSRFNQGIPYSIPLTPIQLERLKKIVQAK